MPKLADTMAVPHLAKTSLPRWQNPGQGKILHVKLKLKQIRYVEIRVNPKG